MDITIKANFLFQFTNAEHLHNNIDDWIEEREVSVDDTLFLVDSNGIATNYHLMFSGIQWITDENTKFPVRAYTLQK